MSEKHQYFNGRKYTRDEKTGYYLNSTHRERIHRAVWEYYNGPIPDGYAIHHIDEDKSNNSIENLQLISRSEHATLHGNERAETNYEWMRQNIREKAAPKAAEWHKSEVGREWHREHGKRVFQGREAIKCTCEECGKEYSTKKKTNIRFCSNACKSKWRRESGIDDVEKNCPVCGKKFSTSKYSGAITCGRSCANRYRARKATAV